MLVNRVKFGCVANNTDIPLQANPTPLYWTAFSTSNPWLPSTPNPDLTPYERFALALWASRAVQRMLATFNEKPDVQGHSAFPWYVPSTGPAPTDRSRQLVFVLSFFELNPRIAPRRKFMMDMDMDHGPSPERTIHALVYHRLLLGQYNWTYAAFQKNTNITSKNLSNPHFSINPLGRYSKSAARFSLDRELEKWTHLRLETAVLSYAWHRYQRNLTLGAAQNLSNPGLTNESNQQDSTSTGAGRKRPWGTRS